MVVQHNLQAMNSNRMLGLTTNQVSSSTEKLSSGYAINRAADNAAGLAISEKMRKQIRGLDQASTNAEDGISCVQTAEGALAEVQDMLQRMNELCVQAANGTNSTSDRTYIQDEIDQLVSEVDRVAETTKFNETYLLKGDELKADKTVYTTSYSVTYAKNVTSNAIQDSSQYKIKYTGTNNVYMVSASVLKSNASTSLTTTKIQTGDEITNFFSHGTSADDASNVSDLGTIGYDAQFNTTSYVAFVNVELNSSIGTSNGTPATAADVNGITNGADADLYIDTSQTGSVVRAAQDLFIYNTDTSTVTHVYAGDAMTNYIDEDGKMKDTYRLVDIVTTSSAEYDGNTSYGSHVTTYDDTGATPTSGWDWTTANLSLMEEPQSLYDSNGTKVSSMALDKFFDENGNYKGGLYTTAQARDIDEVFASEGTAGYRATGNSAITGGAAATISNYIQQQGQRVAGDVSLTLQVGADSDRTNKISANINTLTAAGLGITKLSSKNIGIVDATGDLATDAIDAVADALTMVSRQRASLGAVQNRLEHTISNLDNVVENTTSAESQIRDTDMATEMVKYSNANILQQAGQSMLAQANQSNQGILSLLQ